mmetsp:Transcript_41661/g.75624  ORF Transcript_41661/g.75624 Transcript_41661/m.75624 type:complete len:278 (-) Transcript_41661:213-1046(-)
MTGAVLRSDGNCWHKAQSHEGPLASIHQSCFIIGRHRHDALSIAMALYSFLQLHLLSIGVVCHMICVLYNDPLCLPKCIVNATSQTRACLQGWEPHRRGLRVNAHRDVERRAELQGQSDLGPLFHRFHRHATALRQDRWTNYLYPIGGFGNGGPSFGRSIAKEGHLDFGLRSLCLLDTLSDVGIPSRYGAVICEEPNRLVAACPCGALVEHVEGDDQAIHRVGLSTSCRWRCNCSQHGHVGSIHASIGYIDILVAISHEIILALHSAKEYQTDLMSW